MLTFSSLHWLSQNYSCDGIWQLIWRVALGWRQATKTPSNQIWNEESWKSIKTYLLCFFTGCCVHSYLVHSQSRYICLWHNNNMKINSRGDNVVISELFTHQSIWKKNLFYFSSFTNIFFFVLFCSCFLRDCFVCNFGTWI